MAEKLYHAGFAFASTAVESSQQKVGQGNISILI
jgi:hypothetical protein